MADDRRHADSSMEAVEPIRVLLVDDDADSGEATKQALAKKGVLTEVLLNAEDALERLKTGDFDIVVTDIRLPGMSGVDLLKHIRIDKPVFPVILITGYDSLDSAIQAIRCGAHDYILKPLGTIEDLLIPIHRAVFNYRILLEKERLEQTLRLSEERWKSLVDNAPNIIAIVDREGTISFINRLVTVPDTKVVVGTRIYDWLEPKYHALARDAVKKVFLTGKPGTYEVEGRGAGESKAWYDVNVSPIMTNGETTAVTLIVSDVTQKKLSADVLEQSHRELREVWKRYVDSEEIQRRRLATELHDQIGASLSLLGMTISFLRTRLSEDAGKVVQERMDDCVSQIDKMAECVRDVMSDLRPSVLDDYGLAASLRVCAEKYSKHTGVRFDLQNNWNVRLPPDIETTLFRIAQEAITNVMKHARATNVSIVLSSDETGRKMEISDNGMGFDLEPGRDRNKNRGWGLITMRERAQTIGASFTVDSTPKKGTKITVTIEDLHSVQNARQAGEERDAQNRHNNE
jgi:two-component system sensor histidine kinase UhpB